MLASNSDLPASVSCVLGLKVCTRWSTQLFKRNMPTSLFIFANFICFQKFTFCESTLRSNNKFWVLKEDFFFLSYVLVFEAFIDLGVQGSGIQWPANQSSKQ